MMIRRMKGKTLNKMKRRVKKVVEEQKETKNNKIKEKMKTIQTI